MSWEELFDEHLVKLALPDTGPRLRVVRQIQLAADGRFIVPDGRAKRILVISPDGALVKDIRSGAPGTFEVMTLGGVSTDKQGRIFVFDPVGRWITVLNERFEVERKFQIGSSAAVFVATEDGGVVNYHPSAERIFVKYSRNGERIADIDLPVDPRLRAFHGRVHSGGIAPLSDGSFVGIHPAAFELIHLSPKLRIVERFQADSADKWAPGPPAFPAGLNPNGYERPHEEWWNSFTHIGRIYTLTGDLLVVTLFKSTGLYRTQEFVNIYRPNGEAIARGLLVPHGGRIVGASGSRLFAVRNAQLDEDSIAPLDFRTYSLKSLVK